MQDLIKEVVYAFYGKAVTDPIIGYHFRKIQEFQTGDVLTPPIEAFSHHLPRIVIFWELQLLGKPLPETEKPFNLILAHRYLQLNRGEVGRWVTLFNQTLEDFENEENKEFFILWRERISLFQKKFLNSPHLFTY